MTRRVTFSAAHTDWLDNRTPAENRAMFGQSAQREPYGHNYILDVTVSGDVDPRTGIIVNIKDIDRIVRERVLLQVDHKMLNGPDGPLANMPATGEMLLALIRDSLLCSLPYAVALSALRLEKTALDAVEWQAQDIKDSDKNKMTQKKVRQAGVTLVTRIYEFSASHRLQSDSLTDQENRDLFGKCNYPNGHGHNYVLEVTVEGPVDPVTARVIDPAMLDEIVNREVVDRYDHRHLNLDISEFAGAIPSSEVIITKIWDLLAKHIAAPARLSKLLLRETPRNFFEYSGEVSVGERTG